MQAPLSPSGAHEGARYAARGVSSSKTEVHGAIEKVDKGLFPGAFCKVTPDFLTGSRRRCNVIHADGSGTKSILAYLWYRETGDASVFRGIAQDSIVMNLDDLLCIGATDGILLSSTINRNAKRVGSEVLRELISGTEEYLQLLRDQGVGIHSGGGETADVGDLTPTVVVDSCTTAVMNRSDVLSGDAIRPGLCIVGLSSSGQASFEAEENSGIGSNGLTSARHDLLSQHYAKHYPETFDSQIPKQLSYSGPYRLQDRLPGSKLSVGKALLSPTRSYAPIVAALLNDCRPRIAGLVHCSGGGQTKCLRFGRGVHFVKDALFKAPPIFRTIQRVSKTPWREMYQVYNMGHRLEVYCGKRDASKVIRIAQRFGVEAQVVGHTEKSSVAERNQLTVHHGRSKLRYSLSD